MWRWRNAALIRVYRLTLSRLHAEPRHGYVVFDAKIAEQRSKLEANTREMEASAREFVDALCANVGNWAEKAIADTIDRQAARVKTLDKDSVLRVKAQLDEIKAEFKEQLESEFLENKHWLHRLSDSDFRLAPNRDYWSDSHAKHAIPTFFNDGIATILGRIGGPFLKAGIERSTDSPRTRAQGSDNKISYL